MATSNYVDYDYGTIQHRHDTYPVIDGLPAVIKVDCAGLRGVDIGEFKLIENRHNCVLSYSCHYAMEALETCTEPTMEENIVKMKEFVKRNNIIEGKVYTWEERCKFRSV